MVVNIYNTGHNKAIYTAEVVALVDLISRSTMLFVNMTNSCFSWHLYYYRGGVTEGQRIAVFHIIRYLRHGRTEYFCIDHIR